MRIIAGKYRSRLLKTLRAPGVRPTGDRLRGTLFDVLGDSVPGSVFADCYAGSGAVGLEALSRGAASVYFFEENPAAARAIRENAALFEDGHRTRLVDMPVRAGLRLLEREGARIDICFLDPPYADTQEAVASLARIAASPVMHPEGVIVVQHDRKRPPDERAGEWARSRLLIQGSSALSFYRKAPDSV